VCAIHTQPAADPRAVWKVVHMGISRSQIPNLPSDRYENFFRSSKTPKQGLGADVSQDRLERTALFLVSRVEEIP